MYRYRSRGMLIMATLFAVRLIDTITMLSVRKLGSLGSTSESVPISRIFMMSLPLAFTRGACVGIAVGCGLSVRSPGKITTGSLLVGPGVGVTGCAAGTVAAATVGGTGVFVGVGVSANVAVGGAVFVGIVVSVGGIVAVTAGVSVAGIGDGLGRLVFVAGGTIAVFVATCANRDSVLGVSSSASV